MFFDADYLERATLRDGSEVVLRLVQPDDKQLLREGFARMSSESRYRRFFTPKTELSADELRYLTEVDQRTHVAIGAASADLSRGLGVARCIALPDEPGSAEAALAVTDDVQGRGLGSLLLQRLVAAARERGIERFVFEMLGANTAMAELVRALAPTATCVVDHGVMRMELELPGLEPHHPVSEPPRETGVYRLMAMMARGALQWRALWRGLGERWLGGRGELIGDGDGDGDAVRAGEGEGGGDDAAREAERADEAAMIARGGKPIETEAAATIDDPTSDEPS
jgi:GNAT superfamily N-acetyltransferase